MKTFRVEMKHGQDIREVEADSYSPGDAFGWMIFYRRPAQGGTQEYWRVRLDSIVSVETRP
jgi:hypothetical protein